MPTFDEMYADFGNCMDYLFSNPDGKTCMRCNDDVVLSAMPSTFDPCYPCVTVTCKGKDVLTYNTRSGYSFTRADYNRIKKALS